MFATTFEYNYKLAMWGADGTVYMWVSKTHAARLESSNLSRPTMSSFLSSYYDIKVNVVDTLDKNFVASSAQETKKFIVFGSSFYRPKTIKVWKMKMSFILRNAFRLKIYWRQLRGGSSPFMPTKKINDNTS